MINRLLALALQVALRMQWPGLALVLDATARRRGQRG